MARAYAICMAAVFAAAMLPAQETRGMIYGRVLDQQSAAVPGAAVTVTNTDTNVAMRRKANETGHYEANLLLPGNCSVTVDVDGFRKYLRDGIVLPVSTRLEINADLQYVLTQAGLNLHSNLMLLALAAAAQLSGAEHTARVRAAAGEAHAVVQALEAAEYANGKGFMRATCS